MDSQATAGLVQSINFHGQTLQKLCESQPKLQEVVAKAASQIHFKEFNQRQKNLSFQDRGKRLKLQEFICKNALSLFDSSMLNNSEPRVKAPVDEAYFAANPPFEAFCHTDKETKIRRFYETIRVGETLICVVTTKQSVYGVKVLVAEGSKPYVVAELGIKAVLQPHHVLNQRVLTQGDKVRVLVVEVVPEADKLVIGDAVPFTDPLPAIYKKVMGDAVNESYDGLLHKNPAFNNPSSTNYLSSVFGLGSQHLTFLNGLRGDFPPEETAVELRQAQAAKWAFKNVAEGIEHFKAGRHSEAFQSLNTALNIDPRNLEGLVARGALFANSANFKKAIEDFEMALKINPNHPNTRKYMGETLIALGRGHEEKSEIEEAVKAYEKCLELLPYHEDAINSIEYLRSKNLIPQKDVAEEHKKPKKEKKKKSKKKRAASSSGSSSSSDSSSSDSSSSDSDSSSSDSSESSRDRKKKKRKKDKKEKSLSPISKRMLMDTSAEDRNQCNPAATLAYSMLAEPVVDKDRDYEMRVRSFLEQTKGDSDYEDKVRKFLAEAAKFKPKAEEKEKKKKKKDKKEKAKEKAKKRKEKEEKRKRKRMKKEKSYVDDDAEEEERLRDALRKEISMKQELRKRVQQHESLPIELPPMPSGYFKPKEPPKKYVEEKSYRDEGEQAKNVDIFKDSPPQSASRLKIQINPLGANRFIGNKNKEGPVWESLGPKKMDKPKSPPPLPTEPLKTVVDKFSFRAKVYDPVEAKAAARRSPSRSRSSESHRSRSRSRSYGSRSRSSGSRSRSHSRSRSYDRYSRSRSRSPRNRYQNRYRGNMRGTYYKPRFQNNNMYRPRGNYYNNNNRGRGYYNNYQRYDRNDRFDRYDRGGRGGYVPRHQMGRGMRRPYYHNNRGGGGGQYYDNRRRYDDDRHHSRDRDRSRSPEEPYGDDAMDKVGAVKEPIDKSLDVEPKMSSRDPRRRVPDEPLSEGEAPDSPAAANAAPTNGTAQPA